MIESISKHKALLSKMHKRYLAACAKQAMAGNWLLEEAQYIKMYEDIIVSSESLGHRGFDRKNPFKVKR
jgi:hypothetical protein